jgi:hypothetical protein
LHGHRAGDGIDGTGKLHKHAVTGGFDDPTFVGSDLRIDSFAAAGLQCLQRTDFVSRHHARVARNIGGEDRGKAALGFNRLVQNWLLTITTTYRGPTARRTAKIEL